MRSITTPSVVLLLAAVSASTCLGDSLSVPVPARHVRAGANMLIDFNEEVRVPYSGFVGEYFLHVNLIHDPQAGPMFKRFESPITDTNDRILLDARQPFPQRVNEDFFIVPGTSTDPVASEAVSDWHEEIVTKGWHWVLPGDDRFPNVFRPDQSLITKNGDPHPWRIPPGPAVFHPHKLWVEFSPIRPGNTLDIHKALLWVGTHGNQIWGDDALDDGTFFDETVISVFEHPTPEPGTMALLALGGLALLRRR